MWKGEDNQISAFNRLTRVSYEAINGIGGFCSFGDLFIRVKSETEHITFGTRQCKTNGRPHLIQSD
jgi:hypothetical protein